ncbi:MAG TPA: glycosyltransferase family 39 protein [Stellaceae bacterium]|nr:glycosyltransferase family 39 protein [Stellaceae bacterium]
MTDASTTSWEDRLALALFVVACGLAILTFQDYGVTWDEDVHNWYGVFVLDYYLTAFQDLRSLSWLNLYNYGAAFDMIAAALNAVSPFGTYETRHLLNALTGIVGLIGTWKFARFLGGPRVGLLATLFLFLTPNYYGQMFNNPKDIPFAAAMVWASYYLARLTAALPRPPLTLLVRLGIATGLALGVRVGGFLMVGYLGLTLLLFGLARAHEARRPLLAITDGLYALRRVLIPTVLVTYPVMLLFWPWAQRSPFLNPLRTLIFFSHESFPFPTLYAGSYFPATDLPWSYLPVHVALALPELLLLLVLAAPIVAVIALRRGQPLREIVLPRFVLGFSVVFPILYAVAIKAVLFDGMRHFIFVLPPLAVIAALVAESGLKRLAQMRRRNLIYSALGAYGLAHIAVMVMLHPDEYVYYNAFIGGVDGAQGLFKLDYWANSYAEAVERLEAHLKAEYGADFHDHDFTVAVCGPPISAAWYFPENFIFRQDRNNADFFIAFTKDDCDKSLPGKEIIRVERMGSVLSRVIDRREIVAASEKHAGQFAARK